MLRSSSFFARFQDIEPLSLPSSPVIRDYFKDDHGVIRSVDTPLPDPPSPGTVDDYSLKNLLSAGVKLNPISSFGDVNLDDLSLIKDVLDSEIISSNSNSETSSSDSNN